MQTLQVRTQKDMNVLDLRKQQVRDKLGMPDNSRLSLQPCRTAPFLPGVRGYSSLAELPLPRGSVLPTPHALEATGHGQAAGRPFPSVQMRLPRA